MSNVRINFNSQGEDIYGVLFNNRRDKAVEKYIDKKINKITDKLSRDVELTKDEIMLLSTLYMNLLDVDTLAGIQIIYPNILNHEHLGEAVEEVIKRVNMERCKEMLTYIYYRMGVLDKEIYKFNN